MAPVLSQWAHSTGCGESWICCPFVPEKGLLICTWTQLWEHSAMTSGKRPQSHSRPFRSAPVVLQGLGTERVELCEPLNIPGDFGCRPHWAHFPLCLRCEGRRATVILHVFLPSAFRSYSFTGVNGSDLFLSPRHSTTPDSEHSER